jgi:hypothetical protein
VITSSPQKNLREDAKKREDEEEAWKQNRISKQTSGEKRKECAGN